jgi:hypothetical protein
MGTAVSNRIMDFDKIMIQGSICNKKGYDTGEMFLEPKPAYLDDIGPQTKVYLSVPISS